MDRCRLENLSVSHDIMTIRDYMDPALRAQIGKFSPGPREFFAEVDYRDPEVMRITRIA